MFVVSIALDDFGNLYAAGYFRSQVDMDPGPGTVNITSAGQEDAYLLKLNSDLEYVWVRTVGREFRDSGLAVATMINGTVFLSGAYQGTLDFDPGPGVDEQEGSDHWSSAFTVKYQPDGFWY